MKRTTLDLCVKRSEQMAVEGDARSLLLGHNERGILPGRNLAHLTVPSVPAVLPSELFERCPDMLRAEQNQVADHALIDVTLSLYFSTKSLTGLFGSASGQFSNNIEVLDTERSLFNAELGYTQTDGTVYPSVVAFYKAIGGGGVVAPEQMTHKDSLQRGSGAPTRGDSIAELPW